MLPRSALILVFAFIPLMAAGEEDACYTCAASACYGHYQRRLEALRRDTEEWVQRYEAAYVALDPEAEEEEVERLLAARAEAIGAEKARIKTLYDDLVTCLSAGEPGE